MTFKKLFLTTAFLLMSMQLRASELTDYLNTLNSFKADFVQLVYSPSNKEPQISQGVIIVKSPDKFYLDYTKPYKLVYVADGKQLWSYDADLEQVVVKKQGSMLINTPAMLLGNPKDLTASYMIEEKGFINGWFWFELIPKSENSNFEAVSLAFADAELIAMEMKDSFGQITRLEFRNVIKNPRVANSKFNFIPPQGVDVIGQ